MNYLKGFLFQTVVHLVRLEHTTREIGKQVVQIDKRQDTSILRVHFDLDQYNIIYWQDADLPHAIQDLSLPIPNPNYAEKLANRFIVVVGKASS